MSAAIVHFPSWSQEREADDADLVVHKIHAGHVRTGTIRTRLHPCISRSRFGAGPTMPHAPDVLVAVTETATRCAPWLKVYVGPRLWSGCDAAEQDDYACRSVWRHLPGGQVEYEHRGLAARDNGVLLVASAWRLPDVVATLHHEIWHAVERHALNGADLQVVDRAVRRGRPRPGEYLASTVERRARLYESWACAVDEGWRPPTILGFPITRIDRVMSYVYGGGLAGDIARSGAARAQGGGTIRALQATLGWPLGLLWLLAGLLAWGSA